MRLLILTKRTPVRHRDSHRGDRLPVPRADVRARL